MTLSASLPVSRVTWQPAVRIIPTRFPSVNLFDRVASAEDFDALYALEAMTNPRIREEIGVLQLVPGDERIFGPGSGPIMAAFTHLNPLGSRFSDGSYGVFYAARDKATAIAETRYHLGNFMRATNEPPMQHQMRAYHVDVTGKLHDLRKLPIGDPVYDPLAYGQSQALGKALRAAGAAGVCYRSVREAGGQCIAAFKTTVLKNCRHASHLLYQWDGSAIAAVFEEVKT